MINDSGDSPIPSNAVRNFASKVNDISDKARYESKIALMMSTLIGTAVVAPLWFVLHLMLTESEQVALAVVALGGLWLLASKIYTKVYKMIYGRWQMAIIDLRVNTKTETLASASSLSLNHDIYLDDMYVSYIKDK